MELALILIPAVAWLVVVWVTLLLIRDIVRLFRSGVVTIHTIDR